MFGRERQIFRSKALERVSSPDHLDQMIAIVNPKDWLPLVVLGSLIALAIFWGIVARVPTTVSSRGILIHPRRVLELQTLGSGRLETVRIKSGDTVKSGDIIGRLDQYEIRRRLDEERLTLSELQLQDRAKTTIQSEQFRKQREQTELQSSFVSSQAEALRRTLADAQALEPLLKKRLDSLRNLRAEGFIADVAPELLQAEQAYLENNTRITDVMARTKQLDLQLKESEALETGLTRTNLDADTSRRNQIRELLSQIDINRLQLAKNSEITTSYSGRILEVFA